MKRMFDFCLASSLAIVGAIPMLLTAVFVKLTSKGPVLYWSDRIGRDNTTFSMPKFRTMRVDSPEVASHLLDDPSRWMTPIGNFLRKTSLDELPQLWSILVGHMSFVGPRPALHNQHDLIAVRTLHRVHTLTPGLTGWAQVNGRDTLSIHDKVAYDVYYLHHCSFAFDMKILTATFLQVIRRKGTSVPDALRGDEPQTVVSAKAFVCSAASWFGNREYEKSVADCDRAIRLDAESAAAYNNRAAAWAAQGELAKALKDFDKSIALDPSFATALHNRALLWARMGCAEKANNDLAMLVGLMQGDVDSREAIVEHLTSAGSDHWQDNNHAVLLEGCDDNVIDLKCCPPFEAA
ncbi:MAG: sugar transferase [Pirellulales bacterium]|nr:sugar transferase [Pirellulales bacterium]